MATNKLSALQVTKQAKPGRYGDGGGLWLQVSTFGTKAWIFRYTVAGKQRHMGLGPIGDVTLAEAREAARDARRMLREGIDPIEARTARLTEARAARAKGIAFKDCAARFIAAHEAGWRNEKHAAQWSASLTSYAYPVFGDLPVDAIDTGLVLKAIEPIWTTRAETAARVRGRIESILDWARVRGYRDGENPARWRGHLDKLLPARSKVAKVKHHPAMAINALPAFVAALRGKSVVSAMALEFTTLTASRTGEVIAATWAEFDLDAKVWTVPAERMKAGREHRVPLSPRALEILKATPRENKNPHVFIGGKKGAGLSSMAMLEMLRGMTPDAGLTVHGFRSTFRDWAAERTETQSEVVEAALAHVVGDKVEAAYRRGDLFDRRRTLMEAWATFCGSAS